MPSLDSCLQIVILGAAFLHALEEASQKASKILTERAARAFIFGDGYSASQGFHPAEGALHAFEKAFLPVLRGD